VSHEAKSGWATPVLLVGPLQSPQVLASGVIDLSDPAVRELKRPYHAGFGIDTEEKCNQQIPFR
jgi:hypothetical protein